MISNNIDVNDSLCFVYIKENVDRTTRFLGQADSYLFHEKIEKILNAIQSGRNGSGGGHPSFSDEVIKI